jgi:hypothetical protein
MEILVCFELRQPVPGPAESSTWHGLPQVAHKVIHRIRGQLEKCFQIMGLGRFSVVKPEERRNRSGA